MTVQFQLWTPGLGHALSNATKGPWERDPASTAATKPESDASLGHGEDDSEILNEVDH